MKIKKMMGLLVPVVLGVLLGLGCASSGNKQEGKRDRAELLVDIAHGAYAEGDYTGALTNLFEAEKINPDLSELHHLKALVYHRRNELDNAIVSARRAFQLNPKGWGAANTLGKLLVDAGQFKEAESALLVALADPLNPQSYKTHTNLGILYYRKGLLPQAEKELSRAIKENAGLACVAHYYRGHLRLKEGKAEEAVRDYDRAARKLCGNFAEAHLALGIAYTRSKQYDLARKKFVEVQQLYPDTPVAMQALERLRSVP